ncbi:MAG: hypothetical protein CM15mV8_0780 [Caudoviricetes sp.]|nr:MAG: hypothetical protein CM15mV8_0780 [Caudoviricetes sp.]
MFLMYLIQLLQSDFKFSTTNGGTKEGDQNIQQM